MANQLVTLLWKNFRWCKRHPIFTLMFYVCPILISQFLFLIIKLISVDNIGDCDHVTFALPPSHPAFIVSSLVCNRLNDCANRSVGYAPPHRLLERLANESVPLNESKLCPGLSRGDAFNRTMMTLLHTCAPRLKFNDEYREMDDMDLIYRGQLLFYPETEQTRNVTRIMARILDRIGTLRLGMLFMNMTVYEPMLAGLAQDGGGGDGGGNGTAPPIDPAQLQQLMLLLGALGGGAGGGAPPGVPGDAVAAQNLTALLQNLDLNNLTTTLRGLVELANGTLCYKNLAERTVAFFDREEAVEHAMKQNTSKPSQITWSMLEFTQVGNHFKYSLIPHYDKRIDLSTLFLQALVEAAVIEHLTGKAADYHLEIKLLPERCHKDPTIYNASFGVIQMVVSLGMICVAYALTSEICYEKGAGLLEFLFIAGVPRYKVKISWFIFGAVFMLTLTTLIACLIKLSSERIIEHTPFSLFLIFFLLYGLSLLCMCFLVASVVSTAQRAGILIFVLLLLGYVLPGWGQLVPQVGYDDNIVFARFASLLHSTVACQVGLGYIWAWERNELGAQWHSLAESPVDGDQFGGVQEAMLCFVAQCVFYMVLSWYFDYTAPSKYGLKQPLYFPFTPTFWIGEQDSGSGGRRVHPDKKGSHNEADIEPTKEEKPPGITVQNLTKHYGSKFTAVDDLNVIFFRNEITALLGHNGAGKSTTMNMLTGMLSPSSGTALLDGKDIRRNMDEIRKSLGFCPQYDIIYPELTVAEHMDFYADLKSIPTTKARQFAANLFSMMKMDEPRVQRTAAKSLSGGMKRKLSIAIAYLGEPKTVILDEPTSAIDPFSRRAIWDVILSYRAKSTQMVSTHYMQEADILGDRIAIINHGILKCHGTPMYLKSKYGKGFYLKVAHQQKIQSTELLAKLAEFIPVKLESSTETETNYAVPVETARSPQLIEVFKYLEEYAKTDWGIASFGISESTMEQVFFKVAADDDEEADNGESGDTHLSKIGYDKHSGMGLFAGQLLATWNKRVRLSIRSKLSFVFQIIMPLLFTALMLFMNNVIAGQGRGGEVMHMHPWNNSMEQHVLFYAGPNGTFLDELLRRGHGTRCMNARPIEDARCLSGSPRMPAPRMSNDSRTQCECSKCPDSAANPKPPQVTLLTEDALLNMFGRNISNYLLKTNDIRSVIGGIEDGGKVELMTEQNFNILAAVTLQLLAAQGGGVPGAGAATTATPSTTTEAAIDLSDVDLDDLESNDLSAIGGMLGGGGGGAAGFGPDAFVGYAKALLSGPTKVHVLWTGMRIQGQRRLNKRQKDMLHMKSQFLNSYSNVLLRASVPADKNPADYGIQLHTEEVALTLDLNLVQVVSGILLGWFSAIALMIPSFTTLLVIVNERISGNKQLQFLTGMNKLAYWLANLVWDCSLYVVSICCMIAFMTFFPETFSQDMYVYFLITITFGAGMVTAAYVLSFVMQTARGAMVLVGFVSPNLAMTAMILLNWYQEDWYEDVNDLLSLTPPYFICSSLLVLQFREFLPNPEPVFAWDMLGRKFVICWAWSAIMLALLALFELGVVRAVLSLEMFSAGRGVALPQTGQQDADVLAEEQKVQGGGDDGALTVRQLLKIYRKGRKVAVRNVTFEVRKGECFGLLGVNGAGKSTLFKMLTGFDKPTSGDARILGHSIFGRTSDVAQHMSYCPQENVLFDNLSPLEHLRLYGAIRGIPAGERDDIVDALVHEVGLAPHANKQSHALSGGNKRKLNFAISMLDFPEVIFLDEMTTGMDPKARRAAWNCLNKAIQMGCSTVITSHSMEECESLCNRLVIMVNGQFKCIGGVQYLKDKYGNNYSVKLRLGAGVDTEKLNQQLATSFVGTSVVEEHLGYLEVQMPADNLKLSHLFDIIQAGKDEFKIEEFSVSQTTLEHVFVNMVRDQE